MRAGPSIQPKEPTEESISVAHVTDGELRILINDFGWHAVYRTEVAQIAPIELSGDYSSVLGSDRAIPQEILSRAVSEIPNELLERAKSISILTSDPEIVMSDNRATKALSGSSETVEKEAALLTASEAAVFGATTFGETSAEESDRKIFGFLPAITAKRYLTSLGSLALKSNNFAPLEGALLETIDLSDSESFCILSVNGFSSSCLVGNTVSGAIVYRSFPIGSLTLAHTLADANGVTVADMIESMQVRSYLPNPDSFAANDPADARQQTLTARTLRPALEQFLEQINATFGFFTFQRMGGRPANIFVVGADAHVRGFSEWLGKTLMIEAQPVAFRVPDDPRPAAINYLENTPKEFLRIGASAYEFRDGKFDVAREDQRTTVRGAILRKILEAPLLRPYAKQIGRPLYALLSSDNWDPVKIAACLAGGLALMLFAYMTGQSVGTSEYVAAKYNRLMNQVVLAHDGASDAAEMARKKQNAKYGFDLETFRTSGSLVALAQNVPETVWLTKVEAAFDDDNAGQAASVRVEGTIPVADDDHLTHIADFIERLKRDDRLMRGFSTITLLGSDVSTASPSLAHFKFEVTRD